MRSFITLDANASAPKYGTPGAAGADITANTPAVVPAHGRALIHTGLCISLPCEVEMQIRPRSGLALKSGITVLNTPGTIDEDYRGEVGVILFNTTDEDFEVNIGDRIAQVVFNRIIPMGFDVCESLDATQRGAAGFGSTGV